MVCIVHIFILCEGCNWSSARTLYSFCRPRYSCLFPERRPWSYSCEYNIDEFF